MAVTAASEHHRLVILLHGRGGTGAEMMPIVAPWRQTMRSTRFAAPDAPFPHPGGGRQWFDVDGQELRPDHIAFVRDAFDKLLAEIIAREGFQGSLEQVAFVGVSQGAIMGLDALTTGRWKVGAMVSFAGLLPLEPIRTSDRTPILLVHGEQDMTIPTVASKSAAGKLKAAGYDVTLDVLPGVGHTISPEGARDASIFLKTKFAA